MNSIGVTLLNILMVAFHLFGSVFPQVAQSHSPLCSFVYLQKPTSDMAQITSSELLAP